MLVIAAASEEKDREGGTAVVLWSTGQTKFGLGWKYISAILSARPVCLSNTGSCDGYGCDG